MSPKDVLSGAKEIAELIRKYNNMELYQKIVDLRDQIFEMADANRTLKERVSELERLQELSGEVYQDGNAYFRINAAGEKHGPFCLTCWGAEKKLVPLMVSYTGPTSKHYACGHCDSKCLANPSPPDRECLPTVIHPRGVRLQRF